MDKLPKVPLTGLIESLDGGRTLKLGTLSRIGERAGEGFWSGGHTMNRPIRGLAGATRPRPDEVARLGLEPWEAGYSLSKDGRLEEVFKDLVTANDDLGDMTFVLSDETKDRYGEVIVAEGWKLANFKKNPIMLFGHSSAFPIGNWKNVRVEGTRLLADADFADAGTSARIDEIRSLVQQRVLRTISVGFRPLKSEPMDPNGDPDDWWSPQRYLESELLEASVVSVPANPNALQNDIRLARELGISDATLRRVFGESAIRGATGQRSASGVIASSTPIRRDPPMTTPITKRIEDAQAILRTDTEALEAEIIKDEPNDELITELTERIKAQNARVNRLLEAEQAIAAISTAVVKTAAPVPSDPRRPFAVAAKKVEPKEYVYRAAVATALGHLMQRNREDVLIQRYGDDEPTRAVFAAVTKAATAPAMTTVTGWAAELVQTSILDFIESLLPMSIYPGLSAKGGRYSFGRNGIVSLPSRSPTPTVAGSFVGEGLPIPVRQAAFTSVPLTPKSMKVITTFTRQILQHSTPEIEKILREAIQEDTAVAIDTVLVDATAASVIRPAGLRNGVTVTTATSGGGIAALVGDIKGLMGALVAASGGSLRSPVWIMNPIQAISISMTQDAGGDFAFGAEIAAGNLRGYPVLQSTTVPAGMVILVDAADFFSATGDEPQFDISTEATLHFEDTTPLQLATGAQGSGVLATPQRSLFQTDSYGLRMMLDMNWAMRRTGTIAWTQSVTW